jgi:uncharacterized protein YdeI (BOF family)
MCALKKLLIICLILLPSAGVAKDQYLFDDYKKQNLSNDEEIAVNGKIIDVDRGEFSLDYNSNTIKVETDDLYYNAEEVFIPGEYVKVKGMVDDKVGNRQAIIATRIEKFINAFD